MEEARLGSGLAEARAGARLGPEALLELERALAAERGARAWLRSRPTPLRVALVVALAVLLVLLHFFLARRPDFALYPDERWTFLALLLGVGLLLGVEGALRGLGRPQSKQSVSMGPALFVVALPLLVALLPEVEVAHAASLSGAGAELVPRGLMCFFYGVIVSGPLALLLWFASRQDRLPLPALLFAAGSSGIAGNLMLHAHCPITYPGHLVIGHATVALAWLASLSLVNRLLPRAG